MKGHPFLISATIDFTDDCGNIAFTKDLLVQLVDGLSRIGVRRLYWQYDHKGQWVRLMRQWPTVKQTTENLGGYPMALTSELARERGMEFYAIIKPFETGESVSTPTSVQQTGKAAGHRKVDPWSPGLPCIGGIYRDIDPWIVAHPELRVRARRGDIPTGLDGIPIERIQLRQKDMAPIRIKPQNLEIWTSADNNGYRKQELTFALSEEVETCPRDVFDLLGNLVTRRGDLVRVLNLDGLRLMDPFIAITTDFDDDSGSFRNTAIEMVRAFGPVDQSLPIVVASHKSVWRRPRNFRMEDLEFDGGIGDINVCLDVTNARVICSHCRERGVSDCMQIPLYPEEQTCRDGVIAFAKSRNEYLPCSPCEAYPEIQAQWMEWVGECLRAGVDGIDWRISNHSSWTNTPGLYGFNEPVLEEYERRYGVNPDLEPYDPELLGALRGEFYDRFLWRVKHRLSAAGKKLQLHLEVESFRAGAPQARRRTRPGNITFNWRRWLRTGLADEATLMGVNWAAQQVLNDSVGQEMLREAEAAAVPVHLRHHMFSCRDGKTHADRMEHAYRFGGLSGYNYYDAACLYDRFRIEPDGRLQFYAGMLEQLRGRAKSLGLL